MHFEKQVSRQSIYEGKIISFFVDHVELENGSVVRREVVEHSGGVGMLAIDKRDRILMVRQFRYAAGETLLELPAGKLEKGEDPLECGRRELSEETGYEAKEITLLTKLIPTPAYDTEIIYVYLAQGLTKQKQHLDENEFLTVEQVPFRRALEMCMSGEITDAKTLAGIMKYALMRTQ